MTGLAKLEDRVLVLQDRIDSLVAKRFDPSQARDERGRWASSGKGSVLYHGTTSKVLNRILRQGLLIRRGGKGGESKLFGDKNSPSYDAEYENINYGKIHLSSSIESARFYARQNSEGQGRPILLRLRVPKSVIANMDSSFAPEFVSSIDIKPEWIKSWEIVDLKARASEDAAAHIGDDLSAIIAHLKDLQAQAKLAKVDSVPLYLVVFDKQLIAKFDPNENKDVSRPVSKVFNPNQLRDELGRWTSGIGEAIASVRSGIAEARRLVTGESRPHTHTPAESSETSGSQRVLAHVAGITDPLERMRVLDAEHIHVMQAHNTTGVYPPGWSAQALSDIAAEQRRTVATPEYQSAIMNAMQQVTQTHEYRSAIDDAVRSSLGHTPESHVPIPALETANPGLNTFTTQLNAAGFVNHKYSDAYLTSPDKLADFQSLWSRTVGDSTPGVVKDSMFPDVGLGELKELYVITDKNLQGDLRLGARFEGGGVIKRDFYHLDDGSLIAYHSHFEIPKKLQGQGIAKKVLNSQMEFYKKIGVSQIRLFADLDVGGYAWARMGFVPDLKSWTGFMETRKITPHEWAQGPKHIWEIADSADGKKRLAGLSWDGSLNLNDAKQMRRFTHYVNDTE